LFPNAIGTSSESFVPLDGIIYSNIEVIMVTNVMLRIQFAGITVVK
jgi:hypothetical protein